MYTYTHTHIHTHATIQMDALSPWIRVVGAQLKEVGV